MTASSSTSGNSGKRSGCVETAQVVVLPAIAELRLPTAIDVLLPVDDGGDGKAGIEAPQQQRQHPFMDGLAEVSDRKRTANGAAALASTGSPLLDAFNRLDASMAAAALDDVLAQAWKHDAAMALRIIWNTRSIPDGKGSRALFYRCWGWLFRTHPRTALVNLARLVEPCSVQPLRRRKAQQHAAEGQAKTKDSKDSKDSKERKHPVVKSHGYWKDLLNLLVLVVLGQIDDVRPPFLHGHRLPWSLPKDDEQRSRKPSEHTRELMRAYNGVTKRAREAGLPRAELQAKERFELLEHALQKPATRALYITVARLFATQLLADVALMAQASGLPKGEAKFDLLFRVSLAGKWAPTPGTSHDRLTNIGTAIAALVADGWAERAHLPALLRQQEGEQATKPETQTETAHVLRSFYHRWVLRELRATLELPEPLMTANRWGDIRYRRVASQAMARWSPLFFTYDTERFKAYVAAVEKGRTAMSGATLLPHELIGRLLSIENSLHPQHGGYGAKKPGKLGPALEAVRKEMGEMEMRVIEAQWNALVEDLRSHGDGSLGDTLAVCDVSGSMGWAYDFDRQKHRDRPPPVLPAIALSLLIASLARPPFGNGFITFSARPTFVPLALASDPLLRSVHRVLSADAGLNTNLRAVFLDLLLPMAREKGLGRDDMVKRVFVFSDMQFDAASGDVGGGNVGTVGGQPTAFWPNVAPPHAPAAERAARAHTAWETTYDAVERAYAAHGYDVPQLVFWDLAGGGGGGGWGAGGGAGGVWGPGQTVEVQAERRGVAMMSGFSPAMVKVFLGRADEDQKGEGEGEGAGEEGKEAEEDEEWDKVDGPRPGGEVDDQLAALALDEAQKDEDEFTPLKVMHKALLVPSLDSLVVVD